MGKETIPTVVDPMSRPEDFAAAGVGTSTKMAAVRSRPAYPMAAVLVVAHVCVVFALPLMARPASVTAGLQASQAFVLTMARVVGAWMAAWMAGYLVLTARQMMTVLA